MALKPTIYKLNIVLSDFNQDYYDAVNLTVAQHPSETVERMMVRVLAYCLHAKEEPAFTKGLCAVDEPDLWVKTLDGQISSWIDVGEPAADRIKKATRQAMDVTVYSFNSKSSVWWSQQQKALKLLDVSVNQFLWEQVQALSALVERTMDLSVSISGNSLHVSSPKGECEVLLQELTES